MLKLHKETKKRHQLESTEIRFPLGQGASISGWSGLERLLSFDSVLTQVLPETWVAMRTTGVSHLLTVKQQIPQFQSRNKSSRPMIPAFGRHSFPAKSPISRRKKSCDARGNVSILPLCVGSFHTPFPPPFFSLFPSTSIY